MREGSYWQKVAEAKSTPHEMTLPERLAAGQAAMATINEVRRRLGRDPFLPKEPPEELQFRKKARLRGLLA